VGRDLAAVIGDERPALSVPHDYECSCCAAEIGAPPATKALAELSNAEDETRTLDAAKAFKVACGAKSSK
jgi:hypothetical protein